MVRTGAKVEEEETEGERMREKDEREGERERDGTEIGMCNSMQAFHLSARYSRQISCLIRCLIKKNLHFTN